MTNGNRGPGMRLGIARDALALCVFVVFAVAGCRHAAPANAPAAATSAAAAAQPAKKHRFAKTVVVAIDGKGCPAAVPTFEFDGGTDDPPPERCKHPPCVFVPKGGKVKLHAQPASGSHTKFILRFEDACPFKNVGNDVVFEGSSPVELDVIDTPDKTKDYRYTVQPPDDLVGPGLDKCQAPPDPQMIPM